MLCLAGDAISEIDEKDRPIFDDTLLLFLNAQHGPLAVPLTAHKRGVKRQAETLEAAVARLPPRRIYPVIDLEREPEQHRYDMTRRQSRFGMCEHSSTWYMQKNLTPETKLFARI